jgi:hypothetical protein
MTTSPTATLPRTDPAEKNTAIVIGTFLVLSTLGFTIVHHVFPGVFDVPRDPPHRFDSFPFMLVVDLFTMFLAWLCFRHAQKRLGLYPAMLFLGGSFIFTGLEESMWILLGRYQEQIRAWSNGAENAALGPGAAEVSGTYYFTRGFFWWLETPLLACLGWFFVAYACVYVAQILMPKARVVSRAALGGFLAMDLDLWLDPVQTHETWRAWVWAGADRVNIFSIPLSNFMGWFLLIFLFAIVFERLDGMKRRHGPAKAAVRFYLILIALEFGILVFFAVYGAVIMRLLPQPVNLTVWGI